MRARSAFSSGSSPRSMGASSDAAAGGSGSRPFPAGLGRGPRPACSPSRSIAPFCPRGPSFNRLAAPPHAAPAGPLAPGPQPALRPRAAQRPGLFGFLSDFGPWVRGLFWVPDSGVSLTSTPNPLPARDRGSLRTLAGIAPRGLAARAGLELLCGLQRA